jgi:hypothetical protein
VEKRDFSRARICKRLWSPGIDSEESISPVYVAWRASTKNRVSYQPGRLRIDTRTGFIRGILRGVRYAKSLRVLFLHRRSPSWTTLVLYSRAVFIFNEPTTGLLKRSTNTGSVLRNRNYLLWLRLRMLRFWLRFWTIKSSFLKTNYFVKNLAFLMSIL